MKIDIRRILLAVLYIAVMYFAFVYTRPLYMFSIIQNVSTITYNDDLTLNSQAASHLVLLAYSILSYYWNRRTLKSIGKQTPALWITYWIIDFLLVPVSVLIMVLYHNQKHQVQNLGRVENMFLMYALLISKHLVQDWIARRKPAMPD